MRLGLRLGSAAVLLAILGSALWFQGWWLDVLAGLAVCVACWELSGLLKRLGAPPPPWILYPLALWLLFRHRYPVSWHALDWALGAAVVAGLVGMLLRPRDLLDRGMLRWAGAVGGGLYLGLTIGFLLVLVGWHKPGVWFYIPPAADRAGGVACTGPPLPRVCASPNDLQTVVRAWTADGTIARILPPPSSDDHTGLWFVAITLGSAMVGDTAALFTGTALGRHGFFRSISPRKSVEGAVGGAAGTVATWLIAAPPAVGMPWYHAVALGALVALAAQGGDLVESALKRAAGVKDSSELIPGHGGLLDRLDSLVLLGPVVYAYVVVTGAVAVSLA